MVKYFCVFIKSKNLKHYEKRFQQKILLFRSSHSQMFLQKRSSEENSQNSQKNCLKFYWKRYPEREPFKSFSQAVSLDIIIKTSKWHQLRQYFWLYCQLWKCFGSHHPEQVLKMLNIFKGDICGVVAL